MNKNLLIPLFYIGITMPGLVISKELSASKVFEKASESVVVVESYDKKGEAVSQGSGVVIAKETVISNCHVFKNADTAKIRYQNKHYPAKLLFSNAERDLCSFSVSGLRAKPATHGISASMKIGEKVYAIGAPQGLELTLSDGLLSNIRFSLLQTTAPISPGSSGGGLFDSQGRLIGITTLYFKESQQLNFAVPIEWVNQLPVQNDTKAGSTKLTGSAEDKATLELAALLDSLQKESPEIYAAVYPELKPEIVKIVDSYPPAKWVAETRDRYITLYATAVVDAAAADAAATVDAAATDAAAAIVPDRWKLIYEDDRQSIFLDTKTIKKSGVRVEVWTQYDLIKPKDYSVIKGVDKEMRRNLYSCHERTDILAQFVAYNTKTGKSSSSNYSESPELIIPGSIGEVIFDAVCEK